jgi:hypothetical protein
MKIDESSVRKDEISASIKTPVASKVLRLLTSRVGTIFRISTPEPQDMRRSIPLLAYEALERQKKLDEETRYRAFLAARF